MQRRNRPRSSAILSSPITLIVFLVALVLLARATLNIHGRAVLSIDKFDETSANLTKMEVKKTGLEAKIQDLSTDEGIEASIREKYHAIKPGESVAVIVDTSTNVNVANDQGNVASSSTATSRSWWQKIFRVFGL